MNMFVDLRKKRIVIAIFMVAILPLLIFQFVGATPPEPEDGIPENLPMPELSVGGKPISPVFVQEEGDPFGFEPNDINKDITFYVWYGPEQQYGQNGNPQPWVDILGQVSPSDSGNKITSLTYSLNGGPDTPLSVGPNDRRLALKGDFHVELDFATLNNGPNTVLLKATDNGGKQGQTSVTVNYSAGNIWPKNYNIDWSSVTNVLDVAQVVDGVWSIVDGKLEPFYHEYDRMVAIGGSNWGDYEVTVPVTINGLNPDGFKPIPAGAGLGFILRWPGYFQIASEQPREGWQDLGAIVWNRWKKDTNGDIISGLQMIGYGGKEIGANSKVQLEFGVPYIYKASVQTDGGGKHIYRFKVWEEGEPEPMAWDMVVEGDPAGPTNGSLVLLAHYVDASFGNVTVKAAENIKPKLTVNSVGDGNVTVVPDKASYDYGEEVELTANPDAGQALARWSGGLSGRQSPAKIILTSDTSITAHFVPEEYANVTINVEGSGVVNRNPEETQYLIGEELTLEAVPNPGFKFVKWQKDLGGSENPTTFIVDGNMVIKAIFEQIPTYNLTINPPVGQGTVSKNPDKSEYLENEKVVLTANPAVGYKFSSWSGDLSGDQNPTTLVMDSDKSITAVFEEGESYSLNVNSGANGQVLKSPAKAFYAYGEIVTLTAVPDAGYMLGAWGGDLTGSSSPSIVSMTQNRTVTASFVPAVDPRSDDFNRCELDNGRWSTLDPVGDSTFDMTGKNLVISVPAGVNHNLWTGENNAPRALTPAENIDFEVEVKFDSIVSLKYQIQGIIIRQDNDNLLRFDFHHDGTNMRIFAATIVNGTATMKNTQIVSGNPGYMRVKRIGSQWSQYYSKDGLNWTLSKQFQQPITVNEAGVFAGNAGDNPAFSASIDYFFNTAMPIVPEDATEYTVDVNIEGSGTVSVSPEQENYACGDDVQFTANPGAGAQFTGWSGDLSGTSNPANLIIKRNHSVTAHFSAGSNLPPVFGSVPNQVGLINEVLSFNVSATDPDGSNPPSLSAISKPAAATFKDNGNGTGEFKWTPTINDLGEHTVTFEASDGQLTSTKPIKITVVEEQIQAKVYMPMILFSK